MNIRNIGTHFSDFYTEEVDEKLGKEIAFIIGDTFIDESISPRTQWEIICKALRIHGLKIIEE